LSRKKAGGLNEPWETDRSSRWSPSAALGAGSRLCANRVKPAIVYGPTGGQGRQVVSTRASATAPRRGVLGTRPRSACSRLRGRANETQFRSRPASGVAQADGRIRFIAVGFFGRPRPSGGRQRSSHVTHHHRTWMVDPLPKKSAVGSCSRAHGKGFVPGRGWWRRLALQGAARSALVGPGMDIPLIAASRGYEQGVQSTPIQAPSLIATMTATPRLPHWKKRIRAAAPEMPRGTVDRGVGDGGLRRLAANTGHRRGWGEAAKGPRQVRRSESIRTRTYLHRTMLQRRCPKKARRFLASYPAGFKAGGRRSVGEGRAGARLKGKAGSIGVRPVKRKGGWSTPEMKAQGRAKAKAGPYLGQDRRFTTT